MTKLLAINFGGIGDEILFLPTLKSIRECHRDWHITLLLEPRSHSVTQVTDLVDATLTFDIKQKPLYVSHLLDLLGLLREGDFDIVLSSGSSALVAALLFCSGIRLRVGYDSGAIARQLLTDPVPLKRSQYAADMYHDLTAGLGLTRDAELPEIKVPADSTARMEAFLEGTADAGQSRPARVLVHPGTSQLAIQKGIIKTWSAECWSRLIADLSQSPDLSVILAGGPDDEQTVSDILASLKKAAPAPALHSPDGQAPGQHAASAQVDTTTAQADRTQANRTTAQVPAQHLPDRVVNAFGHTRSLADLAALMELSDVMVCVDSAPMHLGVALRKPLVALFGPTDEKKLLPDDPRFRAMRGEGTGPDENVFTSPCGCRERSAQTASGSGVQLQPETVCQAVKDQLYAASGRGSFQGCGR